MRAMTLMAISYERLLRPFSVVCGLGCREGVPWKGNDQLQKAAAFSLTNKAKREQKWRETCVRIIISTVAAAPPPRACGQTSTEQTAPGERT